jgi:addiction module RelE/StbE family toxin
MLAVAFAHQFKKDWKRLKASDKNITPVKKFMESLEREEVLLPIYDDHPLHGRLQGHRGCHPQSDIVLIYFVANGKITFERVGSHAELFE